MKSSIFTQEEPISIRLLITEIARQTADKNISQCLNLNEPPVVDLKRPLDIKPKILINDRQSDWRSTLVLLNEKLNLKLANACKQEKINKQNTELILWAFSPKSTGNKDELEIMKEYFMILAIRRLTPLILMSKISNEIFYAWIHYGAFYSYKKPMEFIFSDTYEKSQILPIYRDNNTILSGPVLCVDHKGHFFLFTTKGEAYWVENYRFDGSIDMYDMNAIKERIKISPGCIYRPVVHNQTAELMSYASYRSGHPHS